MRRANDFITQELRASREMRFLYLEGIIESLDSGDIHLATLKLRNMVNATGGFIKLAEFLGKNPKSVMRMLSGNVTPGAKSLWAILAYVLEFDHQKLGVVPATPGYSVGGGSGVYQGAASA